MLFVALAINLTAIELSPSMPPITVAAGPVTIDLLPIEMLPLVGTIAVNGDVQVKLGPIELLPTVLDLTISVRVGAGSLRWESAGTPIQQLLHAGTVPGVRITAVAGRCGRGAAYLRITDEGRLYFKAPGSSTWGSGTDVRAGGAALLALDGADPDKWIEVDVTASELPLETSEGQVILSDNPDGDFPTGDISAAFAASGGVDLADFELVNLSPAALATVAVWLDATVVDGTEIRWPTELWYTPTSEADAIATMGTKTIAGSGSQTIETKRIIAVGAAANPRIPIILHTSFDDGQSGKANGTARGSYRVQNAREFRFRRKLGGGEPLMSETPFATNASLPHEPAETFADGDWKTGVSEFSGLLESGMRDTKRIIVVSGAADPIPPSVQYGERLVVLAGGVVRVEAEYYGVPDGSDAADEWAVWFTTDGSAPGSGAPDHVIAMAGTVGGLATLSLELPAQSGGTTVKAVVRTRRTSTDGVPVPGGFVLSPAGEVLTATAVTAGASAAGPPATLVGRVPVE